MNLIRKLKNILSGTSDQNLKSESKYYTSFKTMPIGVWLDLLDSLDLQLLCYHGQANENDLQSSWASLNDEYNKLFSKENVINKTIRLKKRLLLLYFKLINTGDRKFLTEIEIFKKELESETKNAENIKIDSLKTVANLEKYMNFSIDQKKCSVLMFYKYVEIMNDEYKHLNKINKNGKNN